MRLSIVACGVVIAGCATLGGGGRESVDFTVPVPADTALRLAVTQLQLHGYDVVMNERGMIVTRPRAVPQEVRAAAMDRAARQWIVRVEASPVAYMGDTHVRVTGYLMPEGAPATTVDTTNTTPVTADDREVFSELQAIGRWIADAARRHRSGS